MNGNLGSNCQEIFRTIERREILFITSDKKIATVERSEQ